MGNKARWQKIEQAIETPKGPTQDGISPFTGVALWRINSVWETLEGIIWRQLALSSVSWKRSLLDKLASISCLVLARLLLSDAASALLRQARCLADRVNVVAERQRLQEPMIALVAGEDHRFYQHLGVDCRAILRACFRAARGLKIEGASTITQQLVRVLTQRYDRSVRRKAREVLLACVLDHALPKDAQLICYLHIAYFGWRMNGINQAISRLDLPTPMTMEQAAQVIARLKYPEPQHASPELSARIASRAAHIVWRIRSLRPSLCQQNDILRSL